MSNLTVVTGTIKLKGVKHTLKRMNGLPRNVYLLNDSKND